MNFFFNESHIYVPRSVLLQVSKRIFLKLQIKPLQVTNDVVTMEQKHDRWQWQTRMSLDPLKEEY